MPSPATTNTPSSLDTLITPEVDRDEFSEAIKNLARYARIDTVLEIGSSSGEGSTKAWVEGLRQNPCKPKLYCMEVSRVRCEALEKRWGPEGFVECFLGSSVSLDQFPTEAEVERFHRTVTGPLQKYPLEQVLGWLREDKEYIRKEEVLTARIREIKRARDIQHFGAVLIDGSEFTGNAELDEVYGAEFILLDDTQTYKCHAAHQRLLHDPCYELIAENPRLRHGYSIFRRRHRTIFDPLPDDVPVHYFTIVLNGEPFIRYHIDVLTKLPFRWHWHIVEGAATLSHDTAWSKETGGALPDDLHRSGLSVDGTSTYLDELAAKYPDQITVHRKPQGQLWDGKIEMVAEPLKHIFDDSILWQIDADELWTSAQLVAGRNLFLRSPEKAAAWFWCHFFVGENLMVSSRNCYSQNPAQEWLRAWNYRPGMRWITHEPPVLATRMSDGRWENVAGHCDFSHRETAMAGLIFQHFAYATEAQVTFKERYYGYTGAVEAWHRLQATRQFPILLKDFFPWVTDDTQIDTTESRNISPLALRDNTGTWSFPPVQTSSSKDSRDLPVIVVDGVFFQLNNTGIGRVWMETLIQWAKSGVAEQLWLLDRDGTAPKIPGIRSRIIRRYDPLNAAADAHMLQQQCDELAADVFISTYYTTPIFTPTVAMIYDMIPELLRIQASDWQWREKELSIYHASRVACISNSTAHDLKRLHPEIAADRITVTHLAASPDFCKPSESSIHDFRRRQGLSKDYLMVAGERIGIHIGNQGYKNVSLAFKAWSLLPSDERQSLTILCVGGKPELEEELRVLAPEVDVQVVRLTDHDMQLAYAGAVALVYPSLYEGFGLPVVEAMACGCPVITCARASLSEVAGDAACLVNPWDAEQTAQAIHTLRHDSVERANRISMGLAQAALFSFRRMAAELAALLSKVGSEKTQSDVCGALWEKYRALQEMGNKLTNSVSTQTSEIKELKKALKQSEKAAANAKLKAQQKIEDERKKRRNPVKRLWKKICGKK